MNIKTKMVEQVNDRVFRYQVLVNGKNQGFICHYNYSDSNSFWRVDNDSSKENYSSKDDAVVAVCAKNGRKLK